MYCIDVPLSKEQAERIEASAELLYCLIHQRFVQTRAGLGMMVRMICYVYKRFQFTKNKE
jgi:hypothetical protein